MIKIINVFSSTLLTNLILTRELGRQKHEFQRLDSTVVQHQSKINYTSWEDFIVTLHLTEQQVNQQLKSAVFPMEFQSHLRKEVGKTPIKQNQRVLMVVISCVFSTSPVGIFQLRAELKNFGAICKIALCREDSLPYVTYSLGLTSQVVSQRVSHNYLDWAKNQNRHSSKVYE